MAPPSLLRRLPVLYFFLIVSESANITFKNSCNYPVWPGILSNAGTQQPSTTGFLLEPSGSYRLVVPSSWSGRLWARTNCSQDETTQKLSCLTADCGSGTVECSGNGAAAPATLAEFTLHGAGGLDFYDVSLVDGYNIPMLVSPEDGNGGNCTPTGCLADLNFMCPPELKVKQGDEGVACKSACEAFRSPAYCCSGEFANPNTCKPSSYSQYFKLGCPRAYSYAFDDRTSTFTCAGANYVIELCPPPRTSVKSENQKISAPGAVPSGSDRRTPWIPSFVVAMAVLRWWNMSD